MHQTLLAALLALVTASAASAAPPRLSPNSLPNGDPYPSTYRAIAVAPVLLRNATVLTGTGERLDDSDVLMQGGRIAAVGRNLDVPAETTVVDARGKWVTPGI